MMLKNNSVKKSRNIDLHTHTIHSDGALTPKELVEMAKEVDLAAIAISDHENTNGIDEAIKVGKKLKVEIIPAVEITTHPTPEKEHHILGYFINYKDKNFQKELERIRKIREERTKKVVDNLNGLGFQINFGDVKSLASGTIVAPHIAWSVINDMVNKEKLKKEFGDIPDTGEFIRKYLVPGAAAYEPREAMTPKESIDLIHSVGGFAVLAHPCWTIVKKEGKELIFDDKEFEEVVKAGIEGVEVLSHRDTQEDTKKCVDHFTALAKKYKLVITGGSDFHGFGSAGKKLGFEGFYLSVPYEILKRLKENNGK